MNQKIIELTSEFGEDLCKLTGSVEEDYLSLELIFCITKVSNFDCTKVLSEIFKFLYFEPVDIYHSLCIKYSLLILAAIFLKNPCLIDRIDTRL